MKAQLINRWKSGDGFILAQQIKSSLLNGEPLDKLNGIEKIGYHLDLRGITLSELEKEHLLESGNHRASFKTGSLKIKKTQLDAVDFSFSTLSYAQITKCKFTNCIFESTVAKGLEITASDFENCAFKKSNFYSSFMNKNIGVNSGSFINCQFEEVNLVETSFRFPLINNCVFKNCKLSATNFDGSRFENCKFSGKVDSPWFRGYSIYAMKSILWLFNRVDPRQYPNHMINIDFSEAEMIGVSFSDGIDLTKCVFPKGEQYILITNLEQVMLRVRRVIDTKWEDEDRDIGLRLVDNFFYGQKKQQQQIDFIDTVFTGNIAQERTEKIFHLIKCNLD